MPLDKGKLEGPIRGMMEPGSEPVSQSEAARRFADAYHSYASDAIAGTMVPAGLVKETISGPLASAPNFFISAGLGIMSYWMAASWAGPGFTGVTASAAGLGPKLVIEGAAIQAAGASLTSEKVQVDRGPSLDKAAAQIAKVLDDFTKSIQVTMTNVATGATSTVSPQ